MFNRKMIYQRPYYNAVKKSRNGLTSIKEYQQGAGVFGTGYLPRGSAGACSFTVLDYFRAGTQDCLKEWLAHTRSYVRTTQHAARQQFLYLNRAECNNDPLFKLTKGDLSDDDLGYFNRRELLTEDQTTFDDIAKRIFEIYSSYSENQKRQASDIPSSVTAPCVELTFDVNQGASRVGHSTGFILEPPGNPPMLLFMDPNAGIIKLPITKEAIKELLELLQNKLYKDYQLENPNLIQKMQKWIHDLNPILNGTSKIMEREIHGKGYKGFKAREIDYIYELKEFRKQLKTDSKQQSLMIPWEDDFSMGEEDEKWEEKEKQVLTWENDDEFLSKEKDEKKQTGSKSEQNSVKKVEDKNEVKDQEGVKKEVRSKGKEKAEDEISNDSLPQKDFQTKQNKQNDILYYAYDPATGQDKAISASRDKPQVTSIFNIG